MANKKKVTVTLDTQVIDAAQEQCKKPRYRSFSHYVEEAIRLLNTNNSV